MAKGKDEWVEIAQEQARVEIVFVPIAERELLMKGVCPAMK